MGLKHPEALENSQIVDQDCGVKRCLKSPMHLVNCG